MQLLRIANVHSLLAAAIVLCCILPAAGVCAEEVATAEYMRDVKPLLAEKCAACHGALKQEAGIRLDHGDYLAEIDSAALLERVSHPDAELRMPPADEGAALSAEQIATLENWFQQEVVYPPDEPQPATPENHWAFQPIPKLSEFDTAGAGALIDALLSDLWKEHGVSPTPVASPRKQLRRLTFDLIGLPPTIDQQRAFEQDPSDEHFVRIADELLASPAFGQRWARHWMDVWRYSDWDGYKNELRGSQRHIWRWRDWIVQSLCDDKGYDRMIHEMLAGDELAPEDFLVLPATGFLARNFHKSNRDIWLDATVEHTSKAFLGLTVNCARCHDHKYDPISQAEYYSLRAIFEPHHVRMERVPGTADLNKAGLVRAYDKNPEAETYLYVGGNEKQPDKDKPMRPGVPQFLPLRYEADLVTLPVGGYATDLREFIAAEDIARAEKHFEACHAADANLETKTRLTSSALAVAREELISLRARWQADRTRLDPGADPAEVVKFASIASLAERQAKFLAAKHAVMEAETSLAELKQESDADDKAIAAAEKKLKATSEKLNSAEKKMAEDSDEYTSVVREHPTQSTGRRLALAQWITHPDNPLTARVAVNYIWMHHFGQPLVANVFDFGLRSPQPAASRVLDFLARSLIDNGWQLKTVHRLIVQSQAYRLASSSSAIGHMDSHHLASRFEQNQNRDPDNLLFWRGNVRRLDAEAVRDSLLAIGGNLDMTPRGPDLDFHTGESVYRRSLYFRHAYEKQMQMMVVFDGAAPTECYRRSESVVPQQALALANSTLAVDQSRRIAAEVWPSDLPSTIAADAKVVRALFERILGRQASDSELDVCLKFLASQTKLLQSEKSLDLVPGSSESQTEPASSAQQRARENLVHVLINHNDFVTLR